jgi:hypothetical protein
LRPELERRQHGGLARSLWVPVRAAGAGLGEAARCCRTGSCVQSAGIAAARS